MGKHSLDHKIRDLGNFFDLNSILRNIRVTDPGHSCIQSQMNMYIFPDTFSCFGILYRSIQIRNGDPDIIGSKLLIIFFKNNAQDQDRLGNARMTKLQCFLCCSCGKSPDIIIIMNQLCNCPGTMSVAICLDHCNDPGSFFYISVHLLKVMGNGIQGYQSFNSLVFLHNFDSSSPIAKACGRYSMISPASILRFPFSAAARSPQSP